MTVRHAVVLTYTNDDDGIHMGCSCGWTHLCGYSPSLAELNTIEKLHFIDAHGEKA